MNEQDNLVLKKGEDDSDVWDDSELIEQFDESMAAYKASIGLDRAEGSLGQQKGKKKQSGGKTKQQRYSEASSPEKVGGLRSQVYSGGNKEIEDMLQCLEWNKPVTTGGREASGWRAGHLCYAPFSQDRLMYPASVVQVAPPTHKANHGRATVEFVGWSNRVTVDCRMLRELEPSWKEACPEPSHPPGRPPPAKLARALDLQFGRLRQTPADASHTLFNGQQQVAAASGGGALELPPPPPPPPHASSAHHQARGSSQCACSCSGVEDNIKRTLSSLLRVPPPLPPPPDLPDEPLDDDVITGALLNAWYTCGYHAGYLKGLLDAQKKKCCSSSTDT